MGRKRWRERRPVTRSEREFAGLVAEARQMKAGGFVPGVIRCGHPFGNGSMCMTPAGIPHVHGDAGRTTVVAAAELTAAIKAAGISGHDVPPINWHRTPPTIADEEQERRETEDLLNRADRMVPARGLAETISSYLVDDVMPQPRTFEFFPSIATEHASYRRPTYDVLKAAAAERGQFTAEQAQTMLSAALGTRPHLAARVIDKLGPVLAGELARAVDAAVEGRISGYLSAERAELNRIYTDQSTKLKAEREQRGRDVNAERWTTPSRLA